LLGVKGVSRQRREPLTLGGVSGDHRGLGQQEPSLREICLHPEGLEFGGGDLSDSARLVHEANRHQRLDAVKKSHCSPQLTRLAVGIVVERKGSRNIAAPGGDEPEAVTHPGCCHGLA
jgi:hypothetical protein